MFFADLSPGATSTLTGFNVNLTTLAAVPEPVTLALVTFAAMLLALTVLKWAWQMKQNDLQG